MKIGIYKMNNYSILPEFATTESACFDLRSNLKETKVFGYSSSNMKIEVPIQYDEKEQELFVEICPFQRILIPTGLIFAIEEGYSMRIHPRSSFSLKKGLTLSNAEGVIDSDYTNEVFISMTNTSKVKERIYHAERIAQAEIVKSHTPKDLSIVEIDFTPGKKGNRAGGFGSTGQK